MSHFPGRQHAPPRSDSRQSYGGSPFNTPERGGYGQQGPRTPLHNELAAMTLSRVSQANRSSEFGSSLVSRQQTHDQVERELESTRRRLYDLQIRCRALEQERSQYIDVNNASMQEAARSRERRRELEATIRHLTDELRMAQARERALQVELENARNELRRARETIQVQSKAIERPHPTTNMAVQPSSSGAGGARYTEDFGFGPKPVPVHRPDPREELYAPAQSFTRDQQLLPPPPAANPLPRVEWASEFTSLFRMVENFCKDYLNVPDPNADEQWPLENADLIARESSPEHVMSLVSDPRTRYLLITRIILTWFVSHVFHPKIIKSFDRDAEARVRSIHAQLRNSQPNTPFRRALAQAEADTVRELMETPGFEAWRIHQVRAAVNELLARLRPAMDPSVNKALLGNTFERIMHEAWRVGLLLATTPVEAHISFPPSSPVNTLFNSRCMLYRNVYNRVAMTPQELERKGARVALGVSPCIEVTDLVGEGKEKGVMVHFADVVVWPGRA
ncbi:MAG: hypothetical protein L6R39_002548 [Caloplaca ligustica]|nr:MAG: hypothetical protein L6R39_002548 [Caloplaca ligustica]